MKEYLDLVKLVMDKGEYKHNERTGVGTISYFGANYKVDLSKKYPLLTTKKVNFNAVIHELLWYLSGEDHIRNLRKHTKIWDAWADDEGNLETAYGHFWRKFPSAKKDSAGNWQVKEIDQIQYVIDTLKNDPSSRRMVVTAWEPGNATVSKLPPCHYTYVFNVQKDRLNCHLTQRSADIALGVPFNIACYAALTQIMAQETGFKAGEFSHTLVDAHIYHAKPGSGMEEYDHLEGLKMQLEREPRELPTLEIAQKPINELKFEDFQLKDYNPHESIRFKVAV
ncbi:MAG: thymidylate synthase [archaeon]|jgi:thymidylate synthase|nr:thymidylate synthase [Euryarchaeota archaeon]MDP6704064.1 thymidylate synthase [archaeon]|tara:strand:- start:2597 stop:3439 length:843 start_codon:yes stop_codon:yes gene_type:complete